MNDSALTAKKHSQPDLESLSQATQNLALQLRDKRQSPNSSILDNIVDRINPLDTIAGIVLLNAQADIVKARHSSAVCSEANNSTGELEQSTLAKNIQQQVELSRTLVSWQQNLNPLLKEGVTTAGLFMEGPVGLALTIGLYSLDAYKANAKPGDNASDVALSVAKAVATKGLFTAIGTVNPVMKLLPTKCTTSLKELVQCEIPLRKMLRYDIPLKAMLRGASFRSIDTVFSRDTWSDDKTSGLTAEQKIFNATLNPTALACDLAAYGLTKGALHTANFFSKGFVGESPLSTTMIFAAGSGIAYGGIGEYSREQNAHESTDFTKIAGKAFQSSAINALASIPGGMQAEHRAGNILNELGDNEGQTQSPEQRHLTRSDTTMAMPFERETTISVNRTNTVTAEQVAASLSSNKSAEQAAVTFSDTRTERCNQINYKDLRNEDIMLESPPTASTEERNKRLESHGTTILRILQSDQEEAKNCQDWSEFWEKAVTGKNYNAKTLSIQGHRTSIAITDDYATALHSVLLGRIRFENIRKGNPLKWQQQSDLAFAFYRHSNEQYNPDQAILYQNKTLPADLPPILDKLPNSNLIKGIELHGEPYYADIWNKREKPKSYTRADANSNTRVIRLFAMNNDEYLERDIKHEWSHFLEDAYPSTFDKYKLAVYSEEGLHYLERNSRKYAMENVGENFAVLGEEMLHWGKNRFIKSLKIAPQRSAIYAEALGYSLKDDPAETSIYRQQYQNRVNFVKQEVVPRVADSLAQDIKSTNHTKPLNEKDLLKLKSQVLLLGHFGDKSHLKTLTQLASKTKSKELADSALDARLQILKAHPKR